MDLEKSYIKAKREEFLNSQDICLSVYIDLLLLDIKMCEQIIRTGKDIDGNPLSEREIFIAKKFDPVFKKQLESIYEDLDKTNDEEESEELSINDFHQFKTDSVIKEQSKLYHIYDLQKLSYRLTKGILDTGKDSYGNVLTPEEKGHLALVLNQIEMNIASLEKEARDLS